MKALKDCTLCNFSRTGVKTYDRILELIEMLKQEILEDEQYTQDKMLDKLVLLETGKVERLLDVNYYTARRICLFLNILAKKIRGDEF